MSINYNDYNISLEYVDFIIGDDKIPSYQALEYLDFYHVKNDSKRRELFDATPSSNRVLMTRECINKLYNLKTRDDIHTLNIDHKKVLNKKNLLYYNETQN